MSGSALYFPYIDVPYNSWLLRLLLYWDRVGSIVPYDYIHSPEQLAPQMQELVAAGLVEQIFPAAYLGAIPGFGEVFIQYIQRRAWWRGDHSRRVTREVPPTRLHIEKLGIVAEQLVAMGLARSVEYPWYDVEPRVARAFMAYLATILGRLEEVDADPVTNDVLSFRLLGGSDDSSKMRRARARSVILKHVFPQPSGSVEIRDVAEFKARYGHLTKALRLAVESKCIEIANIADPALRDEQAENAAVALDAEIGVVEEAMRLSWGDVVMSRVVPLLGAGAGMVGVAGVAGAVAAGAGLATAAWGAARHGRGERKAAAHPLGYGALFRKRFPG